MTHQPVTLTPIHTSGVWSDNLTAIMTRDGTVHNPACYIIVFPDIIQFHNTERTGGLYGLRRSGPLGGAPVITSLPIPTRLLVPVDASALTDGYRTEADLNKPGVREAIDAAVQRLADLLRTHPAIYRFVYYFAAGLQDNNNTAFESNCFVGNHVTGELRRVVDEENRERGW